MLIASFIRTSWINAKRPINVKFTVLIPIPKAENTPPLTWHVLSAVANQGSFMTFRSALDIAS